MSSIALNSLIVPIAGCAFRIKDRSVDPENEEETI
jgi:hypothetical protein